MQIKTLYIKTNWRPTFIYSYQVVWVKSTVRVTWSQILNFYLPRIFLDLPSFEKVVQFPYQLVKLQCTAAHAKNPKKTTSSVPPFMRSKNISIINIKYCISYSFVKNFILCGPKWLRRLILISLCWSLSLGQYLWKNQVSRTFHLAMTPGYTYTQRNTHQHQHWSIGFLIFLFNGILIFMGYSIPKPSL